MILRNYEHPRMDMDLSDIMTKITANVGMVGSSDLSGSGDCCVYSIRLENGNTCLIDAGTSHGDVIVRNLLRSGFTNPISHLILTHTHYDHVGAAWFFKKKYPDLETIAHKLDVDAIEGLQGTDQRTAASWYGETYMPVKVDIVIQNPVEEMMLGDTSITIFHAPGHTPGSIVATVTDDGKKILFGQDIHGPFMPEFESSIHDWANSMKMLLKLDADILCEGHFGVFQGKDKVKKFIISHLRQNGF